MVTLAPEYVVVQVHGADGPNGGPYAQTLREDDGYMTLEASSNAFLDVPLEASAMATLMTMGWDEPRPEDGLPNYIRTVGPDATPGDIAEFLVVTLRDVYKVPTNAVFELAPLQLFMDVIHGEYGPATGMALFRDTSDPRDAES
jgi:hypothetical protein